MERERYVAEWQLVAMTVGVSVWCCVVVEGLSWSGGEGRGEERKVLLLQCLLLLFEMQRQTCTTNRAAP